VELSKLAIAPDPIGCAASRQRSSIADPSPDAPKPVIIDEAHHCPANSYQQIL